MGPPLVTVRVCESTSRQTVGAPPSSSPAGPRCTLQQPPDETKPAALQNFVEPGYPNLAGALNDRPNANLRKQCDGELVFMNCQKAELVQSMSQAAQTLKGLQLDYVVDMALNWQPPETTQFQGGESDGRYSTGVSKIQTQPKLPTSCRRTKSLGQLLQMIGRSQDNHAILHHPRETEFTKKIS